MVAPPDSSQEKWERAAAYYDKYVPPMRPSAEDIALLEAHISADLARRPAGRFIGALLLGVTPDIASIAWPERSTLVTVDVSLAMIQRLWPRQGPGPRMAVRGDWRHLPIAPTSCDVIVGDGVLNSLRYPDDFRAVLGNLATTLRDDGVFVVRTFVKPDHIETPEMVMSTESILASADYAHFEFQLLMAMQDSVTEGTKVNARAREWLETGRLERLLAVRPAWIPRARATATLWRDSPFVVTFPTLDELRALLREYFDERSVWYAASPLAERCPTVMLTRRRTDFDEQFRRP